MLKNTVFGVYFAYHKSEVLPNYIFEDPNIPNYPPSIARVGKYPSYSDAVNGLCKYKMFCFSINRSC